MDNRAGVIFVHHRRAFFRDSFAWMDAADRRFLDVDIFHRDAMRLTVQSSDLVIKSFLAGVLIRGPSRRQKWTGVVAIICWQRKARSA
jgi:hypothetical protein